MATKTLWKIGGLGGHGTYEIVDVDGTPHVEVNGTSNAQITSLTDSTGGTAGDTIADLADGTTYATDHAAIENNFASLSAKVNAIIAALESAGVTLSS